MAAIGSRAVVVADTGNPAGGSTDADYAAIAATFDTLIAPVASDNFGDPTDIDGNGRVVLFCTRAVHELTPAGSGWYIGGFCWSRDLFPTTAPTAADACAASNAGELFYLMVPDPSGTINDNRFSRAGVSARWQQPGWGYRSIFGALDAGGYPLATTTLADGATRGVTLVGGGAAFLRLDVPADGAGRVAWGTLPTTVQMTVVRTR